MQTIWSDRQLTCDFGSKFRKSFELKMELSKSRKSKDHNEKEHGNNNKFTHLGIQSDGVLSTSHAANNFIGTGLFMLVRRSNRVGFSANTFDILARSFFVCLALYWCWLILQPLVTWIREILLNSVCLIFDWGRSICVFAQCIWFRKKHTEHHADGWCDNTQFGHSDCTAHEWFRSKSKTQRMW